MSGPVDRLRGDFRLENRRHGLGMARKAGAAPFELRRIHGGPLHHGEMDADGVVEQFGAERIGEAADRVLGATVRRLERDRAIGERGTDLYDAAAIARRHAPERGHGAVDSSEIGDFGGALEFLGRDLGERGEDCGHCVIDPDVDGAELELDGGCGVFDLFGIGDVGGKGDGAAAEGFDCAQGGSEALLAPGEKADFRAATCKGAGGGPADPGGGASDYDDFRGRIGGRGRGILIRGGRRIRLVHERNPPGRIRNQAAYFFASDFFRLRPRPGREKSGCRSPARGRRAPSNSNCSILWWSWKYSTCCTPGMAQQIFPCSVGAVCAESGRQCAWASAAARRKPVTPPQRVASAWRTSMASASSMRRKYGRS